MKKQITLSVLILTFLFSNAQYAWVNKNQFPGSARFKSASFVVNGKGYLVAGRVSSSPTTYVNDTWEYDPISDSWSSKASFSYKVAQPFGFSIGSKGYIVGGHNQGFIYQNDTYEYDPVANTWTAKSSYPETAGGGFALVINGKAYVGGGARPSSMGTSMYEYNPSNNTWTSKADYPGSPSANHVGFVIGNFGYAGMGTNGQGVINKEMYKYNPANNTWTSIATFPGKERMEAIAFVVDGHAYVGGGARLIGGEYYALNDFYEYDPVTDTWKDAPSLPGSPKEHSSIFEINNSAYVVNGHDYDGDVYYKTVHEFASCSTISSTTDYTNNNGNNFTVYPNPSSNLLNVEIEGDLNTEMLYDVYSIDGKLIRSGRTNQNLFNISLSGLTNGVYVMSLSDISGKKSVARFEIIH